MIGWTPQQINEMDLWDFVAATRGYAQAHGAKDKPKGDGMSAQRARDLGIEGF